MSKPVMGLMVATLVALAVPLNVGIASAAPVSGALAIRNAAPSNIDNVRYYGGWRGGGWRGGGWGWGRGWGWGVGAGVAAGALIGGALAAPYYYGGYYGAPYGGGYYEDPGYYEGDAVAYCMQRFRTYNPNTGLYMGNDGRRHPCP
jgi:BA14K-like protein